MEKYCQTSPWNRWSQPIHYWWPVRFPWKRGTINFWDDEWIEGYIFKFAFSGIFALVAKKEGKIVQFAEWRGNDWSWKIDLRRTIFDWEHEQWEVFDNLIKFQAIGKGFCDKLAWKWSPSGEYSSNSFCRHVLTSNSTHSRHWKLIWSSLAPHKIKVFCWQLVRGRLAVKDTFLKRGIISINAETCLLCKHEIETIEHFFFFCEKTWPLWQQWSALWSLEWVSHHSPEVCFTTWFDFAITLKNDLI